MRRVTEAFWLWVDLETEAEEKSGEKKGKGSEQWWQQSPARALKLGNE